MADYIRYEKQVPFYGHWDVVVLGGGPGRGRRAAAFLSPAP